MRKAIREILEMFQGAYDNASPEAKKQWEENFAVLTRVNRVLSEPREPSPYAQKLWDRMMNDPEGRKIFNDELDKLLGPEEDENQLPRD